MTNPMSTTGTISLGGFSVVTSEPGKGHPPEFYAERIVSKLIHVSENAPPEIKAQALAYQDALRAIVLAGVRGAIESNHTTIIGILQQAGMKEAAALIYELHRR
jgi:hypothetical protein